VNLFVLRFSTSTWAVGQTAADVHVQPSTVVLVVVKIHIDQKKGVASPVYATQLTVKGKTVKRSNGQTSKLKIFPFVTKKSGFLLLMENK
jgi:hypothetical protein